MFLLYLGNEILPKSSRRKSKSICGQWFNNWKRLYSMRKTFVSKKLKRIQWQTLLASFDRHAHFILKAPSSTY